jgi:iron complex transport system permease protein
MKIILLSLLLIVLSVLSLFLGEGETFFYISRFFQNQEIHPILELRVSRILSAIVVGSMLSVSGAIFQSVFQNSLVSPDILGASSGALLGSILGIFFNLSLVSTQLGALFFSVIVIILAIFLTELINKRLHLGVVVLVLIGLLISSLLSSFISVLYLYSENDTLVRGGLIISNGSLSSVDFEFVVELYVIFILIYSIFHFFKKKLDLLSLPISVLKTQGINVNLIMGTLLVLSTIMTSICVSIVGIIAWVSLIIPNFVRIMIGSEHSKLLPYSAILGSLFLLCCDSLSRSLLSVEVPVGIITGVIGIPMFVVILFNNMKVRRKYD